LKRKGYGSIVDVSACRPDMIADLGRRKGAMLAEDVGDRGADGLARLLLVAATCTRQSILHISPRVAESAINTTR
jgi:hypothetical protein